MSDVNEGVLERDQESSANPFRRCADCEGLHLELIDGRCRPCLNLGRQRQIPMRAEYRYQVRVPGVLCDCDGRPRHGHAEPRVYPYVTLAAAEVAARTYGALYGCEIKVEFYR